MDAQRHIFAGDPRFYEGRQQETYQSLNERAELVCAAMQQDVLDEVIPDLNRILIIPRGSYFMADTVTRMMDIGSLSNLFYAAKSYDDITNTSGELVLGQVPTAEFVEGANILIVDEVCETGKTLSAADRFMWELGAASVTSAVVHWKPLRTETGYKPHYYAEATDKWVEYPSEEVDLKGLWYRCKLFAKGIRQPNARDALEIESAGLIIPTAEEMANLTVAELAYPTDRFRIQINVS